MSDNTLSRRQWLQTSAAVPALTMLVAGARAAEATPGPADGKFTPLDLSPHWNASPETFGARDRARWLGGTTARDGFVRTPAGAQRLQGIPFLLGPEGTGEPRWVVLGTATSQLRSIERPVSGTASFVCLAAFCDWDANETTPKDVESYEQVGQPLAEAVLVYEDGSEQALPVRRRFEVGPPFLEWGQLPYAALTHLQDAPARLSDPLQSAILWGELQTTVWDNNYPVERPAIAWISALENPSSGKRLKALRLRGTCADPLVVCGVTLFHGRQSPLRLERLALYRLELPESADDEARWKIAVDLGILARRYALPHFDGQRWLGHPAAGRGEPRRAVPGPKHLYLEITAAADATLTVEDTRSGGRYSFELARVKPGETVEAESKGVRVEVLEPEKVWVRGRVLDAGTGKPTAARLSFRSRDGRYLAPYGHRTEINSSWFQDYGADLKLADSSFAYVDGTFLAELPVGDVYLELAKGFEYRAQRRKLRIERGQPELELLLERVTDLRRTGWVSADTHVHFLSPSTALLEAQAEGLNLVNLLAAQWRDLFTNVGDLPHGPLTSADGEAMVWLGTENRQHVLGHASLLGGHGQPVFPMSASGPGESYVGDPLWTSMAEWEDACRRREGIVVVPHFPYPNGEVAADIVLGKVDAVEVYPYGDRFETPRFLDWYRYLNCGYRVPVVGGTDKMGAYMPVGANRTYAHIGSQPFTFVAWAEAVRRGRTFMTTGPLLAFEADGRMPGDEIELRSGGGTVEVHAEASGALPLHRLEIVRNGRVVASRTDEAGALTLTLREKVAVDGPGWIAARCSSKLGRETAWPFGIHAHTSPVYVATAGQKAFSPAAAGYFLKLIDGSEAWVRNLATRGDGQGVARVLKTLADARERLHQRLHGN
jgi:hypothetical protein